MKKAITLLLAVLLTLSVFALTACEDNSLEAQLRRAQENTKNAEEVCYRPVQQGNQRNHAPPRG